GRDRARGARGARRPAGGRRRRGDPRPVPAAERVPSPGGPLVDTRRVRPRARGRRGHGLRPRPGVAVDALQLPRPRGERGGNPMSHVLVTGCSSGFGLETAVELAQRDWHVFATMRNLDKRRRLDSFLTRSDKVDVLQLDVTDAASIEHAVKALLALTGRR